MQNQLTRLFLLFLLSLIIFTQPSLSHSSSRKPKIRLDKSPKQNNSFSLESQDLMEAIEQPLLIQTTRNIKDEMKLTGPQGYSPIGFVLFIISVAYILIIIICIMRRVIKARRANPVIDENQQYLVNNAGSLQENENVASNAQNVAEGNYVALNNEEDARVGQAS